MTALTDTASRAAAGDQPRSYTTPGLSLRAAFGIFARELNPRLIGGMFTVALVVRIALGGWGWRDLIVAGVILALEPFTEWVIHVTVLHLRPITLRGRTVELHIARRHRLHHMDPKVIKHVLIPQGVLFRLVLFAVPLYYVVTPTWRQALTGLLTSYAMLLTYEWTHFLIHSTYVPRSWYYRYIWRAHRLHHYKNENYWFGVTVHVADHLLRTFPQRDDVDTSPTARTLGAA
jgi:sterol desaturase/sphingolipid hydroxylase (fatty acid hydroxylase superfamily)